MGGCRDACRSSVGISEESLLSWEVFELLFYFLYFTYILNIFCVYPNFNTNTTEEVKQKSP